MSSLAAGADAAGPVLGATVGERHGSAAPARRSGVPAGEAAAAAVADIPTETAGHRQISQSHRHAVAVATAPGKLSIPSLEG